MDGLITALAKPNDVTKEMKRPSYFGEVASVVGSATLKSATCGPFSAPSIGSWSRF